MMKISGDIKHVDGLTFLCILYLKGMKYLFKYICYIEDKNFTKKRILIVLA